MNKDVRYLSCSLKGYTPPKLSYGKGVFTEETKTKKIIFVTLITTYGVKTNEHATSMVEAEVVMADLFK